MKLTIRGVTLRTANKAEEEQDLKSFGFNPAEIDRQGHSLWIIEGNISFPVYCWYFWPSFNSFMFSVLTGAHPWTKKH